LIRGSLCVADDLPRPLVAAPVAEESPALAAYGVAIASALTSLVDTERDDRRCRNLDSRFLTTIRGEIGERRDVRCGAGVADSAATATGICDDLVSRSSRGR